MEDPAQLFEKFARAPIDGNSGGVGLGLAICRAVTSLHGGTIHASPSAMGGARFVIQLPLVGARNGLATPLAAI